MVSVVGTDTASITAKVDVGTEPHGMSIDPTGTFAYVAKASSPSVSVISTGGTDDGGLIVIPQYGSVLENAFTSGAVTGTDSLRG